MKTIFIYIIGMFAMVSQNLDAQSNNIDFELTSNSISTEGEVLQIASTFIKNSTSVTLRQESNGTVNDTVFTVNSVSGTWDTETSIGVLTFGLSSQSKAFTLVLTGTASGISAELSVPIQEGVLDVFTFTDCTINY